MNSRPNNLAALCAGILLLSACSSTADSAGGDETAKGVASGGELDTALRCWALTSGAYFQHAALADQTGNLPKPDEAIYTGWGKQLAILAFKNGMGFKAFNAMKDKAQSDARVYSLNVDPTKPPRSRRASIRPRRPPTSPTHRGPRIAERRTPFRRYPHAET